MFFREQHITGKLVYAGRFSVKARITDEENQEFNILSLDFWKKSFEVRSEKKAIMSFKKKWTGKTYVKTFFDTGETEYFFRHKVIFKSRYVLTDKDDREMAVIKTKFNRKRFKLDFEIVISDSLKRRPHYFLLVALMVYLCKDYILHQTTVAAVSCF